MRDSPLTVGSPRRGGFKQRLGQPADAARKRLEAAGSHRFGLAKALLGEGFYAACSAGLGRVAKVLGTCCSCCLLRRSARQRRRQFSLLSANRAGTPVGSCRAYGFHLGIETAFWLVPPPHISLARAVRGTYFFFRTR